MSRTFKKLGLWRTLAMMIAVISAGAALSFVGMRGGGAAFAASGASLHELHEDNAIKVEEVWTFKRYNQEATMSFNTVMTYSDGIFSFSMAYKSGVIGTPVLLPEIKFFDFVIYNGKFEEGTESTTITNGTWCSANTAIHLYYGDEHPIDSFTFEFDMRSLPLGEYIIDYAYSSFRAIPMGESAEANFNNVLTGSSGHNVLNVKTDLLLIGEDPQKDGYKFGGWYLDSALTEMYDGRALESCTLYPKMTLIEYAITYTLNGGTQAEGVKEVFNVETDKITLLLPTREGYKFGGWFDNAALTGDAIAFIPKGSIGDITLYAKWEVKKYEVTFIADDKEVITLELQHGSTYADFKAAAKAAKVNILSSFYDSDMLVKVGSDFVISEDMVFYGTAENAKSGLFDDLGVWFSETLPDWFSDSTWASGAVGIVILLFAAFVVVRIIKKVTR